jgi:hypothetical protein
MSSLLVFNRIYRLETQSGIFDPSCKLAPHYLSTVHPPPPPGASGWSGIGSYTPETLGHSIFYSVFGQIPNLQNCFTTPNKNLGGEGASDR